MCGIFGIIVKEPKKHSAESIAVMAKEMFLLSESRGKESSGLALLWKDEISVFKQSLPASSLLKTNVYAQVMSRITKQNSEARDGTLALIGHTRLVTNGGMEKNANNQPVVKSGIVGIHNGIIVNDNSLWLKHPNLHREYDVDTECLISMVKMYLDKGKSITQAAQLAFAEIEGTASVAMLFEDRPYVLLATNNGSLYSVVIEEDGLIFFASEYVILQKFIAKIGLDAKKNIPSIEHIGPMEGKIINLQTMHISHVSMRETSNTDNLSGSSLYPDPLEIKEYAIKSSPLPTVMLREPLSQKLLFQKYVDIYQRNRVGVSHLARCSKCILPESMPFITFDKFGVCNFCTSYVPIKQKSSAELIERIHKNQNKDRGRANIMVMFSGGRDSSFGLHALKKLTDVELVAYTYDWGMITDLGRRNQARMCGALGVEQVLVSADIKRKRANIRKNVLAWLKKPDIGAVPIFMAGDKQYFTHANRLCKEMGITLTVLSSNPYEKTSFKSGFCGIRPEVHTYKISFRSKVHLLLYYMKQFFINPAYLNASLLDSLSAFVAYYFIPHNYLELYEYVNWNEKEVNAVLKKYDWEMATDAETTWRIGDGTAPFYNYIYYTVAGFTENDTFRSNQIREGMLTREEALFLADRDNAPRFESMVWYFETIGVDMEMAIEKINSIPKLYKV